MGMEGRLRRVSEFELAAYKKNPEKFYSELVGRFDSNDVQNCISAMQDVQNSPVSKRVRERALADQPLDPEDVAALRKQYDAILSEHGDAFEELNSDLLGLSKNGTQLSLYKDWHIIHYVLTGKRDPDDSSLGKAIWGDVDLPDRNGVMGYGPAKYLNPTQVRHIVVALEGFPFAERIELFDQVIAEKDKVYPRRRPLNPLSQDEKKSFIEHFERLRDFYREAAKHGNAIIMWIS